MPGSPGCSCQDSHCAIGLDIGGTKVAAGVVGQDGKLSHVSHIATPGSDTFADRLALILDVVGRLRNQHPEAAAIGVGATGTVDWKRGHIDWAINVGYRDLPLASILTRETGLPAVVDNDANAAAWAEARVGVGRGHENLAVLTIGTGIGAGLVLDGRMYRGNSGVAGEVGHIVVNPHGPQCGCGLTGCLETMASGRALGRLGREAAAKDVDGALAILAGGPERVTGEAVSAAALAGDQVAQSLFCEIGNWLGIGIATLVTLLDVELVAIGGGLIAVGELLLSPVRSSYADYVFSTPTRQPPPIVSALFAGEAGIIGAGLLALDDVFGEH